MKKTSMCVEFSVSGLFNPNVMVENIGITPSSIWRKGEYVGKTKLKRKLDGWNISTDVVESMDCAGLTANVVDVIHKKQVYIINYCKKVSAKCTLRIVVYIENKQPPDLMVEGKVIGMIAKIGGDLDIDIIYF